MPSAAVHIDYGRKRPCAFGSVNPRHPGFAVLALILDIMLIYVVFAVGFHAGNLSQVSVDLQVQQSRPALQFKNEDRSNDVTSKRDALAVPEQPRPR